MSRRRVRGRGLAVVGAGVALLVAAAAVVAAWLVASREPGPTEAGSRPPEVAAPTAEPAVPAFELTVDLGSVRGRRVAGPIQPWRLKGPAEEIRRTMNRLYAAGFVDPELWDGGRFRAVAELFADRTRREVRRHLGRLTLGPVARELSAVRPRRARVDVRFLAGAEGWPTLAVAAVDFAGTGFVRDVDGLEVPVRHRGQYTLRRAGSRWRIVAFDVRSRVPSPDAIAREVRRAGVSRGSPELPARGLMFVLVIGSDARPGQSVERSRADSIHIVGVNPGRSAVSILGIPRDAFVPIPGAGTGKINAALVLGGPELLVRTVERVSGIRLDGYVLTGFADFVDLVHGVGGIEAYIPYRMHDAASKAFFRRGPRHLSGSEALAFARNRHDAPGGDFGRSLNQGRLLVAALRELRADLRRDPTSAMRWLAAGFTNVRTDLSLEELADLALAVPSIDARRVENRVVPGSGGTAGGLSVVHLDARANAMFRDLAGDAMLGR